MLLSVLSNSTTWRGRPHPRSRIAWAAVTLAAAGESLLLTTSTSASMATCVWVRARSSTFLTHSLKATPVLAMCGRPQVVCDPALTGASDQREETDGLSRQRRTALVA